MKSVKRHVISVVVVCLAVIGLVAGTYLAGQRARLGLDLKGGLSVTLTAPEGTRADLLERAVETLRGRVDRAGVAEPEIAREGSNNILIQLPGDEDPRRLLRLIGKTAQLQFRPVLEEVSSSDPRFESIEVASTDEPEQELWLASTETDSKLRVGKAEVTGDAVRKATATAPLPGEGQWSVIVDFKREGARKWEEFTGRLACLQGAQRQIAIVLDGQLESHPGVADEVQCNEGLTETRITGSFTETEAKDLALVLTAGALPVKLEQSEVRNVSPTLGRDSLEAGLIAGGLGLALVFLFALLYYRTLGVQIWVGLILFAAAIFGLVVLFGGLIGWSLTLAGIAGLIVSVGIATDSYIVFFERVKEEVHLGRSLKASIDRGFEHAWRTIRTANGVTILAALILYWLAVGPVRGFALAMGVATTLDLAVTYWLSWPLAALLARNKFFAENRWFGMRRALEGGQKEGSWLRKVYRSEFNVDFIGRRKIWFTISAVLVAGSAILLLPAVRGLHYGIDFKGGTIYRVPAAQSLTVPQVRDALSEAGVPAPVVQVQTDPLNNRSQIQVQTDRDLRPQERDRVIQTLAGVAGTRAAEVNTESVGGKWGAQITTKALRGLAIFLLLAVAYMSWRLEPKMAAAGILALFHDLIVTAGIYALVGFEVTPATVVATLTILGYSLYDTVVVFDKMRENQAMPSSSRQSFRTIANASCNQVAMRSVNTTLSSLLPVGSLLLVGSMMLGADTLKDLALALFVGIAAGSYSSIFLAPPVLAVWKEKEPRYAGVRERVVAEAREKPASAPAGNGSRDGDREGAPVLAGVVTGRGTTDRPDEAGAALQPPVRNGSADGRGRRPTPRKRQSRAKRKKAKKG